MNPPISGTPRRDDARNTSHRGCLYRYRGKSPGRSSFDGVSRRGYRGRASVSRLSARHSPGRHDAGPFSFRPPWRRCGHSARTPRVWFAARPMFWGPPDLRGCGGARPTPMYTYIPARRLDRLLARRLCASSQALQLRTAHLPIVLAEYGVRPMEVRPTYFGRAGGAADCSYVFGRL